MRLNPFDTANINVRSSGGGGFPGGGAGGIGCGTIIIAALGYFVFGMDPFQTASVVQGVQQGQVASGPGNTDEQAICTSGPYATEACNALQSLNQTWAAAFQQQGFAEQFRQPTLDLFSGSVRTACGGGSAAMGPFYCPGDQKLYLDTDFFDIMANRMGASGDFAAAYVVAHEVGHHVQNLIGVLPEVSRARAQAAERDSNYLSVLTELQADCFAGIWARQASDQFGTISQQDLNEAMNAAAAVGDDVIQQGAGRVAVPDSFTHGSAADRQEWLARGFKAGTLDACNTFREAGL